MEKKEVDILDLFSALHAARGLIVGGTLLVCVLAGALSFLIPKEYEATAQLLPPKEQKQGFCFQRCQFRLCAWAKRERLPTFSSPRLRVCIRAAAWFIPFLSRSVMG